MLLELPCFLISFLNSNIIYSYLPFISYIYIYVYIYVYIYIYMYIYIYIYIYQPLFCFVQLEL